MVRRSSWNTNLSRSGGDSDSLSLTHTTHTHSLGTVAQRLGIRLRKGTTFPEKKREMEEKEEKKKRELVLSLLPSLYLSSRHLSRPL